MHIKVPGTQQAGTTHLSNEGYYDVSKSSLLCVDLQWVAVGGLTLHINEPPSYFLQEPSEEGFLSLGSGGHGGWERCRGPRRLHPLCLIPALLPLSPLKAKPWGRHQSSLPATWGFSTSAPESQWDQWGGLNCCAFGGKKSLSFCSFDCWPLKRTHINELWKAFSNYFFPWTPQKLWLFYNNCCCDTNNLFSKHPTWLIPSPGSTALANTQPEWGLRNMGPPLNSAIRGRPWTSGGTLARWASFRVKPMYWKYNS